MEIHTCTHIYTHTPRTFVHKFKLDHKISWRFLILRVMWKPEISSDRGSHAEKFISLARSTKWLFVEDILSWNCYICTFHPPFCLLTTPRPFCETLRPSRRSIRKVKLLPEINYLLIRGWCSFIPLPLPFTVHRSSPILMPISSCRLRLHARFMPNDSLTVEIVIKKKIFLDKN